MNQYGLTMNATPNPYTLIAQASTATPVRVPRHGKTEALPVTDGIHFGSRWVLSGKGDSGNTFEVIPKDGTEHPCDYRLRLLALGPRADRLAVVGSEMTVSPEWFTVRARRAP